MAWWPEYEVLERDGRLLVGRSPRVRRGNKVGLGVALLTAMPLLLVFIWIGADAPTWSMASLGVLSAAGGLWCFGQSLAGDFELHESRDIVFDRTGDRVMRKGTVVCSLSGITAVEVKTYPSRHDEPAPPDELVLSFRKLHAGSPAANERIVLLKGLASDLEEPASRIRAYVRHAVAPPMSGRI